MAVGTFCERDAFLRMCGEFHPFLTDGRNSWHSGYAGISPILERRSTVSFDDRAFVRLDANGKPKARNPRRRSLPKSTGATSDDVTSLKLIVKKSPKKCGSEKSSYWKARHRALREAESDNRHLFQEHARTADILQRRHSKMMVKRKPAIARPKTPKFRPPRSPEACVHRRRAYVKYFLNCLTRGHIPSRHIPRWWRDSVTRQSVIMDTFA